jgi:hypothetical protein
MDLPTEFPNDATWHDLLDPAMKITEKEDADAYFETLIQHALKLDENLTRETAVRNMKSSLGYFAGYYSSDVRARVEEFFDCAHPVFGRIEEKGEPTLEEAFKAGVEMAAKKAKKDS